MKRFLKQLAQHIRRRSHPPPPILRVTPEVMQVIRNDEVSSSVCWSEVQKIIACKTDCYIVDEICVGFLTASDAETWLQISEEWPGFQEAKDAIGERFPSISKDWFATIMAPAFERKETLLWESD